MIVCGQSLDGDPCVIGAFAACSGALAVVHALVRTAGYAVHCLPHIIDTRAHQQPGMWDTSRGGALLRRRTRISAAFGFCAQVGSRGRRAASPLCQERTGKSAWAGSQ